MVTTFVYFNVAVSNSIKMDLFLSDTSFIHKPVDSTDVRTRGQSKVEKMNNNYLCLHYVSVSNFNSQ